MGGKPLIPPHLLMQSWWSPPSSTSQCTATRPSFKMKREKGGYQIIIPGLEEERRANQQTSADICDLESSIHDRLWGTESIKDNIKTIYKYICIRQLVTTHLFPLVPIKRHFSETTSPSLKSTATRHFLVQQVKASGFWEGDNLPPAKSEK